MDKESLNSLHFIELSMKNSQLHVVSVKIYDIFGPDKQSKLGGVAEYRRVRCHDIKSILFVCHGNQCFERWVVLGYELKKTIKSSWIF